MKLKKNSMHDICVEAARIYEAHEVCFIDGLAKFKLAAQLLERLEKLDVEVEEK